MSSHDGHEVKNWKRTEALAREAVAHRIEAANRLEVAATSHTLSWTLRLQGRLEDGEALLRNCLPHTSGMLLAAELMERPEIAVACARTGRIDEARAEIARCREVTSNGEDWRGRSASVDWAAGVVEASAGHHRDAVPLFTRAATTFERYGCAIEQAETFYWQGLTLGDPEALDAAIRIYERVGAGQPFIDRARAARSLPRPPVR